MTYKMDWLVPNRVLDVVLPETANDEFLLALDSDVIAILDNAAQPVHILMDVRNVNAYPSAQIAMKMKYYKHSQLGRIVLVGMTTNPVVRFLGNLVERTVGLQIKGFITRDEAISYLATIEQV